LALPWRDQSRHLLKPACNDARVKHGNGEQTWP
jgi:hypothetical protein